MAHVRKTKFNRLTGWNALAIASLTTLAVAGSGCGPQVYKRATLVDGQNAPGDFVIPAKVDILFAQDDSGSLFEAYGAIKKEFPKFLSGLETAGWDHHFATVPLTRHRSIDQILASKYDTNWFPLGQWKAPFPGAEPFMPELGVNPHYFRTPDYYSDFLTESDLSNSDGAYEPGISKAISVLSESNSTSSGFLRSDALLVVIFMSNGQDTSGAQPCIRSDGFPGYCGATSISVLRQNLVSLKGGAQERVKAYAAISPYTSALSGNKKCLGANARAGTRYQQLASGLGGEAYDICNQPVSSVLGGMSQHLRAQRLQFVSRHILLDHEPDTSQEITVAVLRGGTQRQVIRHISEDPSNGWEYVGFQNDVPLIDLPVSMNRASGYFIRLHGDSVIKGKDKPEVEYKPAGTSDSHT